MKDASRPTIHVITRRELLRGATYGTAGLLVGSAFLAGCGSGNQSAPAPAPAQGGGSAPPAATAKPKLRVWLFKTFLTAGNDVLEKQVKAWAAEKNVDVEVEFTTVNDIWTKYTAAIEAGNPPDVGELDHVAPVRYNGMGQLLDLTDTFKKIADANGGIWMPERTLPAVEFGGKVMAIPRYSQQMVLFYRTDLFQQKGLKPPETWDDVMSAAKAITDAGKSIWGMGLTPNRAFDGDTFLMSLLWGYGGNWVDKSGKKIILDSPETRAAVNWAVETFKQKVQPPGAEGWTDSGNNEAWLAGKIGMTINAASIHWAVQSQNHALKDVTGVVPMVGGPKGRVAEDIAFTLGVFKKTKYPELAQELLVYLGQPKQMEEYTNAMGGQAAPLYVNQTKLPIWQSHENLKAFLKNGEFSRMPGWPGPVTTGSAEVRAQHILPDMVSSVLQGTKLDDAVVNTHKKIEKIYKDLGV